tara:strand:- start:92 stop:1123 length:1032 start_codon:yes stop_codon:yes gene_type:complete
MAYTTINKGESYFNTLLYTGNGGSQNITGVGFSPDWVWLKGRNNANNHNLNDTVRGVNKQVYADLNNAETTATTHLTAFDSDGFTLGNDGAVNGNSDTYVSYNWLAGGSASSNGTGDITSSVSVNTTAGFSIVSYTGNGSATQTVGHGLGAVPKLMIFKRRNSSSDWIVYHNKRGATKYISLNSTGAGSAYEPYFGDTEPTSSVFTVDTAGDINGSGETFIAYCFAEKQGFSKFGIYRGNGSSTGPYVHCGFKPAWVLQKNVSATQGWQLQDNKRNGFNGANKLLQPHTTQAESDVNRIDILSNGFRVITTDAGQNTNGSDYIYIAFAKSPYVSSTGVPTNAR